MEVLNAGEIVELAVRRQNVNISELSRRMCVNRKTLYNWFQQKKLHTDVIFEIGKVINYDFSHDFDGKLAGFSYKQESTTYKNEAPSEHANSVYYWMEKYITLLEDYKKLLHSREHKELK